MTKLTTTASVCNTTAVRVVKITRADAEMASSGRLAESERGPDGRMVDPQYAELSAILFHERDHEYRFRTTPVGQLTMLTGQLCNQLFVYWLSASARNDLNEHIPYVIEKLWGEKVAAYLPNASALRTAVFDLQNFQGFLSLGIKTAYQRSGELSLDKKESIERGAGLMRSALDRSRDVEPIQLTISAYDSYLVELDAKRLDANGATGSESALNTLRLIVSGGVEPVWEYLADKSAKVAIGFQPNRLDSKELGLELEQERELIFSGQYDEHLENWREMMLSAPQDLQSAAYWNLISKYKLVMTSFLYSPTWSQYEILAPAEVKETRIGDWTSIPAQYFAVLHIALYPAMFREGRLSMSDLSDLNQIDTTYRFFSALRWLESISTELVPIGIPLDHPAAEVVLELLLQVASSDLRDLRTAASPKDAGTCLSETNLNFLRALPCALDVWTDEPGVYENKEASFNADVIKAICNADYETAFRIPSVRILADNGDLMGNCDIDWLFTQLRKQSVLAGLKFEESLYCSRSRDSKDVDSLLQQLCDNFATNEESPQFKILWK